MLSSLIKISSSAVSAFYPEILVYMDCTLNLNDSSHPSKLVSLIHWQNLHESFNVLDNLPFIFVNWRRFEGTSDKRGGGGLNESQKHRECMPPLIDEADYDLSETFGNVPSQRSDAGTYHDCCGRRRTTRYVLQGLSVALIKL
ncbi:unnamed protein product [Protopolystoma xenopodis]|uniref:Uncharacterized protein n=1 Tax=Protopolystoma xenopodis TaxID=117903 RepID=A0A3S5CEB7_9PLAT|nr:unnamed protein product [Protopolystoma xenopodis]